MQTFRNMIILSICGFFLTVGCQTTGPDFLFVINARSGVYDGQNLKLDGVEHVLYFSDRPERISGEMKPALFKENWDNGKDSFEKNPPNAVLSILNKKGVENLVLELVNLKISKEGTMDFEVRIIKGKLNKDVPVPFSVASLFIDYIDGIKVTGINALP